ncbi:DUF5074 domain-containing protein [Bacteroides sp.]|uniref:YncE family protein n=1 Tax=Bacteroides sp. TaxID=29523 RepID=UPI0026241CF4|nr:DUF5074 domain-containing protein [Bacteroides sp.]
MKVRSLLFGMLCMLALGASLASCSDDDDNSWDDSGSKVTLPQARVFILNEGSYQANNAGIAFYAPNGDADFISDIFKTQNNAKLGDTGQSMIEYEDEIYVAVYKSNYLVKLNAAGVELKRVSFVNDNDLSAGIRYIDAEDGYIYASFWGGVVAKINASTLTVEAKLTGLGDNLEGVAICKDMLYVANSCTPDYNYHTEVKVIDLHTFTLKETLTVATNPYTEMLEEDGKVFLISNDYSSVEGYVLQMIDPANNNKVTKIGNATYMAAKDGVLYLVNSITDWTVKPYKTVNTYFTYNIKTGQISNTSFLKNAPAELASITLHMLEVNDNNGDFYIGTSEYTTNGTIYRFKKDGTFVEKFDAGGMNPNTAIFFN